ncbi:hypothetical protein DDZ14_05825 [Maritimibacter sp. 55A14]|uniref:hypothetical protein n=1 Tax=Maritimibacter sp. 55A14 TaxID=2174844 RepID=UPI000D60AAC2|nr:hypothetical protein [Maritimibacter sp. 55A14]PWE33301.1 hypothetical protein DDZ14_05825 [Maritimibacter sp. 55A14]
MPRLVKLFIFHGFIGVVLGAVFTGMLLWFNVANLGHLVTHSPEGWLAVVMLVWFSGITFGGVQIGIRVMGMAEPEEDGTGGRRDPIPEVQPVPVEVYAGGSTRR